METQRILSRSRREVPQKGISLSKVLNRILLWFNGTKFNPTKLSSFTMGMMINITLGEICSYRLVQQDIRDGELPSYTADLLIVNFAVFEAIIAPLVSWWGYSNRKKLFIGYIIAIIICLLSWFSLPEKLERNESELCDTANSENNIRYIGTSSRTVYRLVIVILTCVVFVTARVAYFSHSIAYSDEYASARISTDYGILLIPRIVVLVLGYKMLTFRTETFSRINIPILIIGTTVNFVLLPCGIPSKAPLVDGVQMEALPSNDRGLGASIYRVLKNPLAMTQMFAMGLLTAALWGYGYYESDIIKVKFNLKPSSHRFFDYSQILFYHYVVVVVVYAGSFFSAPLLKEFCKSKTLKLAVITSVIMFGIYIAITFLPRCDTGNVVGIGKNYYVRPKCSLSCNCKPRWSEFKPVCVVDEMVTYVSPCQAGCRESQEINGIKVYSGCACAGGGRVLERACGDAECRGALLLHTLLYHILITFGILTLQAQGVLLLKIVDPRDKSVGQGMAFSFIAILTFAVGHSIFYIIQAFTCRWFEEDKCHLQSEGFPYIIGGTCAFLMLTAIITTIISWKFLKVSKEDTNEDFETRQ